MSANVERIHQECRQRGVLFVVANQQARSLTTEDRAELRGLTLEEETELVRQRLETSGSVKRRARDLLIHYDLMKDLESWARDGRLERSAHQLSESNPLTADWSHSPDHRF